MAACRICRPWCRHGIPLHRCNQEHPPARRAPPVRRARGAPRAPTQQRQRPYRPVWRRPSIGPKPVKQTPEPYVPKPYECKHRKHRDLCTTCSKCPHGTLREACFQCSRCPHGTIGILCKVCHTPKKRTKKRKKRRRSQQQRQPRSQRRPVSVKKLKSSSRPKQLPREAPEGPPKGLFERPPERPPKGLYERPPGRHPNRTLERPTTNVTITMPETPIRVVIKLPQPAVCKDVRRPPKKGRYQTFTITTTRPNYTDEEGEIITD